MGKKGGKKEEEERNGLTHVPICCHGFLLSDKMFPALGFGAQLPPDWKVCVFVSDVIVALCLCVHVRERKRGGWCRMQTSVKASVCNTCIISQTHRHTHAHCKHYTCIFTWLRNCQPICVAMALRWWKGQRRERAVCCEMERGWEGEGVGEMDSTIFYSAVNGKHLIYCFVFISFLPQVSHEFAINFNPTNPFCSGETLQQSQTSSMTQETLIMYSHF